MRIGSQEHRALFCRAFIDTHVSFQPAELPWPQLDDEILSRLRGFPFWPYAYTIEARAGRMVTAFAETIEDPLIREAIALQGFEETRHGRLMAHVLERYGIEAKTLPIPDAPPTAEEFLTFGYGECRDSFIGFGAIALARERNLFPDALLAIFERVLFEEARHISFFVNWATYEGARRGEGMVHRLWDEVRCHARAIAGSIKAASTMEGRIELRDAAGFMEGVTPAMFLVAALAENRRMFARLDARLVRPALVPALATAALIGIRLLPPRTTAASPAR